MLNTFQLSLPISWCFSFFLLHCMNSLFFSLRSPQKRLWGWHPSKVQTPAAQTTAARSKAPPGGADSNGALRQTCVCPSNFSGQRGNSTSQHRLTRADNLALMPKTRFNGGEVEGYESEEETETMAPARPLDIWGAEKSDVHISWVLCALLQRK